MTKVAQHMHSTRSTTLPDLMKLIVITLPVKLSGAVYCNRSCLWVCGGRCLWLAGGRCLLPR